jgi:general secretion pathway protein E
MDVEPYLVSSTLIGVLAQRLVRTICIHCRKKLEEGLWQSSGCAKCSQTGFLGRTGIYELLEIQEEVALMIGRSASLEEIRSYCTRKKMRNLYEDGMLKVAQGMTTLEEVQRVCWQGN